MNNFKKKAGQILARANIKINGKRPWDIKVHNPNFYHKVIAGGSLALGETYMNGWWDCRKLDEFFNRVLRAKLHKKINPLTFIFDILKARLFNLQKKTKAFEIGKAHYDIGNDLYKHMLGSTLMYTCAYWKNSSTLDKAQKAKLELVCKKIRLKKGMKVLDIGCGWGGFAKYAAQKYKVKVVGITVSKEQAELARKNCKGLPVQIKLQDYRDIKGKFDRIVSLGMFEHVGYKNYRTYLKTAHNALKENGLFLLHTIGGNKSVTSLDPWMNKYIFPNGMLPSIKQIGEADEDLFIMEDWHNFGAYYDKTLMAWFKNFDKNWNKIKSKYDKTFYRMWKYYLLSCAGSFRSRTNQLWQIVFSKNGVKGVYKTIR